VAFLGSSIGNFDDIQIRTFLGSLWASLNHNDVVLIGFDLRKNARTLSDAYFDSPGVTAEFNLNLLTRMNAELGANFSHSSFDFHSLYDPVEGAVHSYLIANEHTTVYVPPLKRSFTFREWEAVHTEVSRKFTVDQVHAYAEKTGFRVAGDLMDDEKKFLDSVWVVEKQ
jgi:L-histidine N-alpha-methyltransferase